MLGRGVATEIRGRGTGKGLVAPEVVEFARAADLCVLNLECCISERGERWPDPRKPFFFRAPPAAVETLTELGVDCVTLANNHALDYGPIALADTLVHLDRAGIAHVGAGRDVDAARRPAVIEAQGCRVAVIGVTDHPAEYAARPDTPGVAFADLWRDPVPAGLLTDVASAREIADIVLVTPHWGPNMAASPELHVRAAAARLVAAGATLVAGHSAHVFHGVALPVLFDLGDFLDDYAWDPDLRNDLGLLWRVTVSRDGPRHVAALPLCLDYCHTRVATGADRAWIVRRFRSACAEMGTGAGEEDGLLVVPAP